MILKLKNIMLLYNSCFLSNIYYCIKICGNRYTNRLHSLICIQKNLYV